MFIIKQIKILKNKPDLRIRRSGNNSPDTQKFTPYWSNYIFQMKSLPFLQVTDTECIMVNSVAF